MAYSKFGRKPIIDSIKGINVEVDQSPDGTWWAEVKDDAGETLYKKEGAASDSAVKHSVLRWARKTYPDLEVAEARKPTDVQSKFLTEADRLDKLADAAREKVVEARQKVVELNAVATAYELAANTLRQSYETVSDLSYDDVEANDDGE